MIKTIEKTKDVLITGATGVIGQAIAQRLAKAGYRLHLAGRNPTKLNLLKEVLAQNGLELTLYTGDFVDLESAEKIAYRFVEKSQNPYGLICNAGNLGILGSFLDVDFNRWRASITENFLSHAVMIRAFSLGLKKRGLSEGRIVTLSGAGLGGSSSFAGMTSYSTAKAAFTHFVEAVAPELMPVGITINAISPGQVLSGLIEQTIAAGIDRVGQHAINAQKSKETGGVSPDLAAQLIEFLLGASARRITGRLLSARFDQEVLRKMTHQIEENPNTFRLRRIDNKLFSQKEG